jgi:PAS domain S-box-containing protein
VVALIGHIAAMKEQELQRQAAGDPRLAVHATSPLPAWLWSSDGTKVLWANPIGARLFGVSSGARLGNTVFGPADPRRRQVAQLAHRLSPAGTVRMQRLRGFGAALGTLATCACARLDFADGETGILIVATEPIGRAMPLLERLHRLVCDVDAPVAAFDSDGHFVAASPAAAAHVDFRTLAEAGLEDARLGALKEGRSQAALGSGQVTLQRVGRSADLGLLAFITPAATQAGPAPSELVASKDEPPKTSTEAVAISTSPIDLAQSDEKDEPPREISSPDLPQGNDRPAPPTRRYPLRFMWQMDAQGRFSLGSDAFTRLIGVRTAAGFGRTWHEIADVLALDPEGLVLKAVATREAWSGIHLNWPVDDGSHLPVELSGLPIHDAAKNFVGYRGFGVCRDLNGLARLDALRSQEFFNDPPSADMILSENGLPAAAGWPDAEPLQSPSRPPAIRAETTPQHSETAPPADLETPLDTHEEMPNPTPPNVIPFRPSGEPPPPVLSPVENTAFDELARQLSARLDSDSATGETAEPPSAPRDIAEPAALATSAEPPSWLAEPERPARGASDRDRVLMDLLPIGVLIYRLDRLLYANRAFLERMGYSSLHALEREGGLDALYVEPGVSSTSSTSDNGTPVVISAPHGTGAADTPIEARLHTIAWDEDSAHALIFAGRPAETTSPAAAPSRPVAAAEPSAVGHANAEDLASILDAIADGILMFDAEGNINSCNRSAEALFGYDGAELAQRNLGSLLAPEGEGVANQDLESLKGPGAANLQEHGREVRGRTRGGGLIQLSMTVGRTQAQGPNFFAVFRDLSQSKKSESELREARRLAERAAHAKADLLARISHELRTPLNAIIGFSDMMIDERFGALGNERYAEYMKDVRASGERVIAVIDDLTDLSRIETGKLDLAFSNQNLNDVVESCVAVMQPQASRERIIIRTSLTQTLPHVVADALALRQITMNLIGNSIHLANAGGQVIVSTALTDLGAVALRIRDTGHGLNDNEVAAAMEPFRNQVPPDQAPASGVSLSLTKALVEANRAQFNIRTGTRSGTLVEVVFPQIIARART